MELKDTCDLMCSSNHNDRLVGETLQCLIRWEKLGNIITLAEEKKLAFDLECSLPILRKQLEILECYTHILMARCAMENHTQTLLHHADKHLEETIIKFLEE